MTKVLMLALVGMLYILPVYAQLPRGAAGTDYPPPPPPPPVVTCTTVGNVTTCH